MPVREAELDEWMSRLARGDRTSFEPLYVALRPRALHLARARIGDNDAEDVAQSALLKVFSRASEFTPGRPCLPWFYAIVSNEIQTDRRRRARLVGDAALANFALDAEHADAGLIQRELERALELAVDALDDDAANAIRAVLGRAPIPTVSHVTFRKRVSRAYMKLRLLLGGHDVQ